MAETDKQFVPITQAEANYVELSPSLGKGQACATCRFFIAPSTCSLIENFPKAIQNTGYCDRFEEGVGRDAQNDMVDAISEGVAEGVSEALEEYSMMEMSADNLGDEHAKKGAPGVRSVIRNIFNFWRSDGELPAFKALGDGYWFASYSNNFEDVDKEILSLDAHDRYLARVHAGLVPLPELWFMHTKGTRHGEALHVWRQGHVMMAVGTFDETPLGASLEKYYLKAKAEDIKLSHGFLYPVKWGKRKMGDLYIYEDYNTYEITTLPASYARPANPYTNSFLAVQEIKAMPMTEKTREALLHAGVNEKLVTELEGIANNSEAQGEKVAELGVAMKAFDDLLPDNKQQKDAEEVESVDASLLEQVILNQKSQQDVQDKLLAIMEQVPAAMKSYEDKIKQLQDSVKDKDAQLNAVPKSVAAGNADASKLNGQEIAEAVNELEERKSGASNEPEDAISKMDRLAKEGRL
jgi:hypothetical protein